MFYVTTPIYYVNAQPHIGHAYTNLAADVLARFHRLFGEDVFFLTGTDEYGKKVAEAAEAAGKKPQEFVDDVVTRFKKAWSVLGLSNNDFIRTTSIRHKKVVKKVIEKLEKDIYKGFYEDWYCTPCETFWTETQLEEGNCPSCGMPVEELKEEAYFFKLSKYQDKLLKFYKENPKFIQPEHRKKEIINRVEEGLKDLSITRKTLKWGIEFPLDSSHVIYVWVDALSNYLSAIDYPRHQKKWPANIHLMAKEILWFHAVIWPAMLMSMGEQLPEKVYAHGWLTVEGEKMSKSKGNVIDPIEAVAKYGLDSFRYYMFSSIPFGEDGNFSEKELVERHNNELIANYGNLFNRITKFICDNYKTVPEPEPENKWESADKKIHAQLQKTISQVKEDIEAVNLTQALKKIMFLSSKLNKYIQEKKPWEAPEKNKTTLYIAVNILRTITQLLQPFMPEAMSSNLKALNIQGKKWSDIGDFIIVPGHEIKSRIAFKKMEINLETKELKPDLRIGTIFSVKDHPKADKLYVLDVNMGKNIQLVAGLKPYYEPQELEGKQIIVVTNLEHKKIRGVESQGMLLAAENGVLITTEKNVKEGSVVDYFSCKNKINFKEFKKYRFTVKENKLVVNDKEAMVSGISLVSDSPVENGTEVI